MPEKSQAKKRSVSADWFVHGVLTKIGDTFDRLTGRGWKPSSSLATSELAERLKALVDAEARETADKRRYVPHNIALKMQWDKFSTDSEEALRKLKHELLTALVDHINDRRYYTYAPISLTVKPDYFTNGVKLFTSFDMADEDEREVSLDVTVPSLKVELPAGIGPPESPVAGLRLAVRFAIAGKASETTLDMEAGRRLSVGRTKENDLALDDPSVSKMHASLLLKRSGELVVADTGSTNGTFLDGGRIAYGKGIVFSPGQKLRFGTVAVELEVLEPIVAEEASESSAEGAYQVGEFEFTTKPDAVLAEAPGGPKAKKDGSTDLAPTVASIPIPDSVILQPLSINETAAEPTNGTEQCETQASDKK